MANIFRKSSLDKLSNPEQLDRAITISSPLSWLAIVGVLLIIAATVIWSIFGTLPTTMTLTGVVVSPSSVDAIYSNCSGTIEEVLVKSGSTISKDTEVLKIKKSDGSIITLKSSKSGIVSEILVTSSKEIKDKEKNTIEFATGETATQVYPGSELIRITPNTKAKQIAVCYVPSANANQLKIGMKALISPSSIDTQKYGHIESKIIAIGEYPAEVSNMVYVLGDADNSVISQFTANGPVVAVICELEADDSTKSGFKWSGDNAKEIEIANGSYLSAKVIVDECAPISKLITDIKDKMEG